MWEYTYADELYHSYDELYHYGVPGMKWGHRKAHAYAKAEDKRVAAKQDMKKAKKDYKDAKKSDKYLGVREARAIKATKTYTQQAQKQIDINSKGANMAKKLLNSKSKNLTKDDRKSLEKEYKQYTEAAKRWTKTRDDIMKMDISTINARDVKDRFKNTSRAGLYVY